jgi:hypothetical protein
MSQLIPGRVLNVAQRRQVLAAFVHRWTHENARQSYQGQCPGCVQRRQCGGAAKINGMPWHQYHAPLASDEQWLADHAFYITVDGRLARRPSRCEPVVLAGALPQG